MVIIIIKRTNNPIVDYYNFSYTNNFKKNERRPQEKTTKTQKQNCFQNHIWYTSSLTTKKSLIEQVSILLKKIVSVLDAHKSCSGNCNTTSTRRWHKQEDVTSVNKRACTEHTWKPANHVYKSMKYAQSVSPQTTNNHKKWRCYKKTRRNNKK